MKVCADFTPYNDQDEVAFRNRALRDAVICVGWLKLASTICYMILYFLVCANSKGSISNNIQIMILSVIPFVILNGILLFFGALEENICALRVSLLLYIIITVYNTVLGAIGAIYFVRLGLYNMHLFLALIFGILAISICTVTFHDIVIIYVYKNHLCRDGQC